MKGMMTAISKLWKLSVSCSRFVHETKLDSIQLLGVWSLESDELSADCDALSVLDLLWQLGIDIYWQPDLGYALNIEQTS
jgi:hypothetical protein